MEPHPLPQQILDVEFKLFGAFSLRQFIKVFIACAIGFCIYFIEPIPIFIRIILIGIVVILGFLFATINRFENKFINFIKAMFISPRYIWTREYRIPEILSNIYESTGEKLTVVTNFKNTKKIDINEIPLSSLFQKSEITQNKQKLEKQDEYLYATNNEDELDIFSPSVIVNKYFDTFFDKKTTSLQSDKLKQQNVKLNPKENTNKGNQENLTSNVFVPSYKTLQEYLEAIKKLKLELAKIKGDPDKKDIEENIMLNISKLINEIKIIQSHNATIAGPIKSVVKGNKTQVKPLQQDGQIVYGIVVDNKNIPIEGATVEFVKNNQVISAVKTDKKGRFVTNTPLPIGEYHIRINNNGVNKFFEYKINVGTEKLPGYKLRAR
ncbi:MAG: carboxypeptidase regulatory-like domain-containing protein [Candidatus Dojkabacteria bacterium]|nr:carboxypeptidase regulatory-like domain-containing protein [Candidatus Dojkabacteria bacterium]